MRGKFALSLAAVFAATAIFAEEFSVTVVDEGRSDSVRLVEQMVIKAKKEAIARYIKRIKADADEEVVRGAVNEYENFIVSMRETSRDWQRLAAGGTFGQLSLTFKIELDDRKLNQYLGKLGVSPQSSVQIVVLEEPPSMGQIKLNGMQGDDKFFMLNYTQIQRRVRDAIVKKCDEFGLKVKLLADNPDFAEFTGRDSTLVGAFYDPDAGKFVIDKGLLEKVRSNLPDTLVLLYRMDTMYFDQAIGEIKVTIAINVKNLADGSTKSVGTQSYAAKVNAATPDAVIDSMALCAESAVALLMNEAGPKINGLLMAANAARSVTMEPIKLSINGEVFDAKIRRTMLYAIKKELINRGYTTDAISKITGDNLTATILGNFSPDDFVGEKLSEIFNRLNLAVSDDKINVNERVITVRP